MCCAPRLRCNKWPKPKNHVVTRYQLTRSYVRKNKQMSANNQNQYVHSHFLVQSHQDPNERV